MKEKRVYFSKISSLKWNEPPSKPLPKGHKFYSFYKPEKNRKKLFMLTDKDVFEIKFKKDTRL